MSCPRLWITWLVDFQPARSGADRVPLIGACCELSGCEPVEARVRSVGVVVDPPVFDDPACLAEVREHVSLRHSSRRRPLKLSDFFRLTIISSPRQASGPVQLVLEARASRQRAAPGKVERWDAEPPAAAEPRDAEVQHG